jgi:hypothetical protein
MSGLPGEEFDRMDRMNGDGDGDGEWLTGCKDIRMGRIEAGIRRQAGTGMIRRP